MLEQRDLVLIAEVVEKAILPVKNDVSSLKEDMSALKAEMSEVKSDVSELKEDMSALKAEMSEVKSDVSELKEDVSALKVEMSEVKSDVSELKEDVWTLKSDMIEVKDNMGTLQGSVRSLELTLENETNKGIKIIAEGHLDLSRKLDEALMIENEKETMKLHINYLESEMKKMKTILGEMEKKKNDKRDEIA